VEKSTRLLWRHRRKPENFNFLFSSNLGLVGKHAKYYRGQGLDYEDLFQEGGIGLMKAIERFDEARKICFSTYASWWIKSFIRRAIEEKGNIIRIPSHVYLKLAKFRLGKIKKMTLDMVMGEKVFRSVASLDFKYTDGDGKPIRYGSRMGSTVSDEEKKADGMFLKRDIDIYQRNLSRKERRLVSVRFGLGRRDGSPLSIIAKDMGLSRQRVYKKLEKVKEKMRINRLLMNE